MMIAKTLTEDRSSSNGKACCSKMNGLESGATPNKKKEKTYRPALQTRSMKTEQSFVTAAEELFASTGYDGTRIADICKQAGCSTGSFYHRYVDKFGLFKFMLARYSEQVHQVVEGLDISKEGNGSLENLLIRFTESAFQVIDSNVGFFRAADELTPKHQDIEIEMLGLSRAVGDKIMLASNEFCKNGDIEEMAQSLRYASQVVITLIVQTRLNKAPMLPREKELLLPICVQSGLGIVRRKSE
ncbi:TetR/AcrR family transcriptional regulator [Ruegeria pomeroyi]|nr:TetR/AcrR family transcriptional regulator [Ruegeria pomeroyi]